jgi:soluble lytic murein transglycosylase-like protein
MSESTRNKSNLLPLFMCLIVAVLLSILGNKVHNMEDRLNDLRDRIEQEDRYRETLQRAITESARHRITGELALNIILAADSIGIPTDIAFSLVREESSFRPRVVSHAGAIGLTQVMPRTGASINPDADLFDPKQNLEVGFTYLRYLLDKYNDDYTTALVAYNVGPTRVDRFGVKPYRRSIAYANRVME